MESNVLEYINTAVAIATFLISNDLKATVENVRQYFAVQKEPLDSTFLQVDEIKFVAKLIIDDDLLRELSDLANGAIHRERNCLKKATDAQSRDACARRAEKDVCDLLNRILDRNQDELPTEELKKRWLSYRCARI